MEKIGWRRRWRINGGPWSLWGAPHYGEPPEINPGPAEWETQWLYVLPSETIEAHITRSGEIKSRLLHGDIEYPVGDVLIMRDEP